MLHEVDHETVVAQGARIFPKARSQGKWMRFIRLILGDLLRRKPYLKNLVACFEDPAAGLQRYPWQTKMAFVSVRTFHIFQFVKVLPELVVFVVNWNPITTRHDTTVRVPWQP